MLSKTPVRWGTIVTTLSDSFKGNPRQTFKLSINCMASKICLSNDILLNSCSTLHSCESVVPENIHTPPPHGRDRIFQGGGGSICLIFQWGGGSPEGNISRGSRDTLESNKEKTQKFTWTIYLRTYKT